MHFVDVDWWREGATFYSFGAGTFLMKILFNLRKKRKWKQKIMNKGVYYAASPFRVSVFIFSSFLPRVQTISKDQTRIQVLFSMLVLHLVFPNMAKTLTNNASNEKYGPYFLQIKLFCQHSILSHGHIDSSI